MVGSLCGRFYSEGVKPLTQLISPNGRLEKYLLLFLIIYFYFFLFCTLLLRNDNIGPTLMGYDTISNASQFYFPYVHCWHLRHPLMAFFSLPLSVVRYFLSIFAEDPGWVIYVLPMPFVMSLSCLMIFKIQRHLGIRTFISLLTTMMFCSFGHVILLSGQYESFPISLFLLLTFTLYTLNGGGNIVCDNIFFATIAGLTSTNVLKIMLAWITKGKIYQTIVRVFKSSILFGILMIIPTLQLILASLKHGDFWGHFITNATSFTFHEVSTFSALWNNFLCEPIFFHNLGKIFYDPDIILNNTIGAFCSSLDQYTTPYMTYCICIIYISVIFSWAFFRKQQIVKLCLSYIVVDLFILLVLGYGKNEAQLFCLHWIFSIPIALGLLLNAVINRYVRCLFTILFSCITMFCFSYNSKAFVDSLFNPVMPDDYSYQLRYLQGMTNKHQNVTTYKFYLFGMGNRTKMVYRDCKLFDIDKDSVLIDFSCDFLKDSIVPDKYMVCITNNNGNTTIIKEDENAVWIVNQEKKDSVSGTNSKVNLPSFNEFRFGKLLRVLHHEILFNVNCSKLYPNVFAYKSVWYRDAAMGVMVLEKTHNISLVKEGIGTLSAIYDNQNGEEEGDNIGEYIFMKSIVGGGIASEKDTLLYEIEKHTKTYKNSSYIIGRTDGVENDYYATAWLKYALKSTTEISDVYSYPENGGGYKYLCWFAERPNVLSVIKHAFNNILFSKDIDYPYPYLDWALSHSFGDMQVPMANGYPLSWESDGSKADFSKMSIIAPDTKGRSICFPHLWTASEMFLYLMKFKKKSYE